MAEANASPGPRENSRMPSDTVTGRANQSPICRKPDPEVTGCGLPAGQSGGKYYGWHGNGGTDKIHIRLQYRSKATGAWGPLGKAFTRSMTSGGFQGPQFGAPVEGYDTAIHSGWRAWRG